MDEIEITALEERVNNYRQVLLRPIGKKQERELIAIWITQALIVIRDARIKLGLRPYKHYLYGYSLLK